MTFKIGIDVGGTFTDFLLTSAEGSSKVYKVLSTPGDPSLATMTGLEEMASDHMMSPEAFMHAVEVIVHGTTVTTNAVLTYGGAKTALLTTKGFRDTLEMRRGVREAQYDNRYRNVKPLVERYLRLPIEERLDYQGKTVVPLNPAHVDAAADKMQKEGVEAVAICFMNAFTSPRHEEETARIISQTMPQAYLTVSSRLLSSIRLYDRVSTTVLNAYVGPILSRYIESLTRRLRKVRYTGVLLLMQSNGGITAPELAGEKAAATLLSGPAGGPLAGVAFTAAQGYDDCISVDMGGTSFDASLIKNRMPMTTTRGEINRLRLALPMLNVVTIGAGGGSIGWIDEGNLLKMGPQSAGAKPGPACYDLGGERPTCTDADLVLGYLNKDFFAGGRMPLNLEKARLSIREHIARPLKIDLYEAAAGMYNVINVNMAAAVREVSVKQGYDPRDFPLVVAGGAGPNHACMIAMELEIPIIIIPRASSIYCAAGMLMSDLKHDFVRTYPALLREAEATRFGMLFNQMQDEGLALLKSEKISEERIEHRYTLDLRYREQYHEINVETSRAEIEETDWGAIEKRFHHQHDQLFGYSLENEATPVELINLRLTCIDRTEKPRFHKETYQGDDPSDAWKAKRDVFLPVHKKFKTVDVFDGAGLKYGNKIYGPAVIEETNTTTLVTPEYNAMVDVYGSYTLYVKNAEKEVERRILN